MKYFSAFLLLLFLVTVNWSCSRRSLPAGKPVYSADGKYDYGPPSQGASAQLNRISHSIYRLNVLTFYESYTFNRSTHMTLENFKKGNADKSAVSHTVSNQSVLGTASVVYTDKEKAALLTCAHIVTFQDTIITYFPDSSGIIRDIAIKLEQKNYVIGLKDPNVKVLAADNRHDIALLRATLQPGENVRMMPFPLGKSSELDWGTFIYIMGFPKGYKMVESGIVSKSKENKNGFFLSNAIINRGFSGGPVFAIRDGSPHFEWVGMASSSSANDIFYLEPNIDKAFVYSKSEPYKGGVLINNRKLISYGVAFSVPMEEIVRFVKSIEPMLKQQGFFTQQFFHQQQ